MAMRKVSLMLPLDVLQRIDLVAKRVKITRDQVINVILAIEVEKAKDANGRKKKKRNKKSND